MRIREYDGIVRIVSMLSLGTDRVMKTPPAQCLSAQDNTLLPALVEAHSEALPEQCGSDTTNSQYSHAAKRLGQQL